MYKSSSKDKFIEMSIRVSILIFVLSIILTTTSSARLIFIQPTYTQPQIIDLRCPNLSMSDTENITVYVMNTGNVEDNYTYQSYTNIGTILPRFGAFSSNIPPGGNSSVMLAYQSPSVPQNGQVYQIEVKACSNYVFNGGLCDVKTCQGFVTYKQPTAPCLLPLIIPIMVMVFLCYDINKRGTSV